jgi:peptide-methionine (S)-S-oxide reductase
VTQQKLFVTKWQPKTTPTKVERAGFAAGCFWGVEEEFRKLKGVLATAVGYSGGHKANATYKEVCAGDTGHAETVLVDFDPTIVTYEELVNLFWKLHDPTTLNRQGPDVGEQYRSVIFYFTPEQKEIALKTKSDAQGQLSRPIVTEIIPNATFYFAEDYHQQYVQKGGIASCHFR